MLFRSNVDLLEQNVFLAYCEQQLDGYDSATKSVLIKILQERNSHAVRHESLNNSQSRFIQVTQKFF